MWKIAASKPISSSDDDIFVPYENLFCSFFAYFMCTNTSVAAIEASERTNNKSEIFFRYFFLLLLSNHCFDFMCTYGKLKMGFGAGHCAFRAKIKISYSRQRIWICESGRKNQRQIYKGINGWCESQLSEYDREEEKRFEILYIILIRMEMLWIF